MKDKVTFKIVGAPGTGKSKILTLLQYRLTQRGFYSRNWELDQGIQLIKEHVELDVNEFKVLERIVVVTNRADLLEPFDRKTLKLWIDTSLSYSICAEIFLEVIKPALDEIQGLVVEYCDPISHHLKNPAIFPLREIDWNFSKHYPVRKGEVQWEIHFI
ncbi:hypothetical protein MOC16_gp354 [Klebsiella phage vB_KpM_FBKp24]|uniref:Uncharacterized protein n=1 Tax=Klebsiella phage vB_KpM_FBKp24 TaxID=2801834 RepID=A0A7U0J5H7_9CAUD|nr:hypothetical protein MOC16_gp354 [Klebsiella phage vB_KpM_FBKp24]QQV92189.1 hypothetical protein vBKpMFBKp24_059 [Klebsiella phage vB_KpM_FBKp24]